MDSRKIAVFIRKANRRLKLQFIMKQLQIAVSLGLASALLIIVISRLFIFPYYGFYAYFAAALAMLGLLLIAIRQLPRRQQAINELDRFTPHNQLLTLSQIPKGNRLADDLAKRTEKEIHLSYQLFKKDKNDWFVPKWLLISLGLSVLLMISGLFPASTQLEAKDREQEQQLIEEMIEKVEKQKEEADSPNIKKELESLEEKLTESETPEQALRELVKKQKELAMKQQQKEQEGTRQANEEAEALEKVSAQLAEQAGNIQTALSEMGKPVAFDLQQSIAANDRSGDPQESGREQSESEGAESGSEQAEGNSSENAGSSGESGTAGEGGEQAGGDGEADDAGDGQGGDSDSDSSSGGEDGSAAGQGSGQGNGTNPGDGAGTGQGSRELLSIPSRIGGAAETTVDGGELSEGEGAFEEGTVDAERGSVRPYQEVVGSYSDSYFSSAERMKLPPDLQNIVEQYFSSIESE